jgi:hypothetical protein
MDRSARLPIDCPRCENRGLLNLNDDDATLPCPLCNNWCMLCLTGVPTFVPIARLYRGALVAGLRSTTDGEILFEGYACDHHKATLHSYSYIAPLMLGSYQPGEAYLAAQGRVFAAYRHAPYGSGLYPCLPELAVQAVR